MCHFGCIGILSTVSGLFKKNVCCKSVSTAANRPANELIEEKMR